MHQRSRGAPPMGAFERIDANGDGVVSREELGLRVYMYVYIYIYREREIERERDIDI